MGLRHAVVTTVVRDDLPDGGASQIAETIHAIHRFNPGTTVEILVSDFSGDPEAIQTVLDAGPEVFCHNIETVERLYSRVRDRRFRYRGALGVLRMAGQGARHAIIKSALMVGHGESPGEVEATLRDLREAGCEAVCVGQYLRPSRMQVPVTEFVEPVQFARYEALAYELGFAFAVAGPFVRSSYRSEALLDTPFARDRLGRRLPAASGQ
jgi:lipoic acid synthetase